jgi:hypothetical protein
MIRELTPGLFVTTYVVPGHFYVLTTAMLGVRKLSGVGGSDRAVVIAESDWNRIDPARREELLDEWTRLSADKGARDMRRWLSEQVL